MIFFPFVYNVTDVLFNVNARGSLVGGNGVTVGGVGSITGVASGVEFGASVAAGVGTVGVGTCVGVVVGATVGVGFFLERGQVVEQGSFLRLLLALGFRDSGATCRLSSHG